MQGYRLENGEYNKKQLSVDEIWDTFNWLFSNYSRNDASYKFIFLKSIIDCIDRADKDNRISFEVLFEEFTRISWNLVLKYGIAQKGKAKDGRVSTLERILNSSYTSDDTYEELSKDARKKICHKVKQECKKYVVGALYGDTNGFIYSFSKKEEWVELNPQIETFIRENMSIIENLNYYKWSRFYELINDENKEKELHENFKFNIGRKNESIYRTILAYEFEMNRDESISRINTLDLLVEENELDNKPEVENVDVEKELYKDFSHMKKYLEDPIVLLQYLQKEKGIV